MLRSVLSLLALCCSAALGEENSQPLDVADRTCLFLDDHFISEQRGLRRVWHQGQPTSVVLERNEKWEAAGKEGGMHLYGSALYDPQDKLYKLYYQVWSPYVPGAYMSCVALSKDARTWQKPHLGQIEIQGNKNNNVMLMPAAHPHVFIDPNEMRPEARYKMMPWCMGCLADGKKLNSMNLFESPNGLRWKHVRPIAVPSPKDDTAKARTVLDAYHIFWDPLGQRYYGTFRAFPTHPGLPGFFRDAKYKMTYGTGGHRRAVAISTTPSLDKPFPASETVLRADAADDRRPARLSKDDAKLDWAELYILPAFNYGNYYIGWLSLLEWVDESDTHQGAGDLQLAFSNDGRQWKRPAERPSAIARGEDKSLFATYAMGNEPIDMGDEMWVFYTEANGAHPIEPLNKFVSRIRAASWRKDGFASLEADDRGTFTTRPLKFSGASLRVNCEMKEAGSVRVALLDEKGDVLPGFDAKDCRPLTGNHIAAAVTWQNDVGKLPTRPIRLRFEVTRGRVWSFRFAS